MSPGPSPPPLKLILLRGLKRRCPRCGVGPLFRRGIAAHERCSACGLLLQRDRGDLWMFMIITDRLPIMALIIALYFGIRPSTVTATLVLFACAALPVIATISQRQGLALALDYYFRVRSGDPTATVQM
jgi:uncharacterized protein (DUF983 family)